jgi:sugar phosphate isomerase/epimerase
MKIAVQTYTIRNEAKVNLADGLKRLVDLGINHIELARIPLSTNNINTILESGLKVISLQLKLSTLEKSFDKVILAAKQLNARYVIVSTMPLYSILGSNKSIEWLANKLNHLSSRYQSFGITLCYHHHDYEFKKINDKTKLELLSTLTNRNIKFIIDTYWTRRKNYDPIEIISKYRNRIAGLHLRACYQKHKRFSDGVIQEGLIDFKTILKKFHQIHYGAIEINSKKPYEEIKESYQYIQSII